MDNPLNRPTEVNTAGGIAWWKEPWVGAYLHSAITFIGGLLTFITPVVLANLGSPTPLIVLPPGGLAIATAALNFWLSWQRNRDTVVIPRETARSLKAIPRDDRPTVEALERGDWPATAPGHEWDSFRETHRTPLSDRLADLPDREPPRRPPG